MADPIDTLVLELARLPGVGERSAARLAYYIIKHSHERSPSLAEDLAGALLTVSKEIRLCRYCANFSTEDTCVICSDARRERKQICVVEGVSDLRAIEQTGIFRGHYHVLHGAISLLDGIGPEELRLGEFVQRVLRVEYEEVVLATNANTEGDATALYIARALKNANVSAEITRLASGVPLGGELEYVDQATLGRALTERRAL